MDNAMAPDLLPELDWNGPRARPFRRMTPAFLERPVFEVFAEVARRWPDRTAIHCLQGTLTYRDLLEWARAIGAALADRSAPDAVVGLALPVDRRFPAAMLGALGAGRIHVPLDLSQPAQRLSQIIEQAGMTHVLACPQTRGPVEALLPPACAVINVEATRSAPPGWRTCGRPDDLAYLIYTSGTTGRPKGVFQNQRGLMHDVMQYTNSVHFSELDVTSLLYSPGVNGAIRDIYGALLNGGCLCMVDLKRDGFRGAAARLTAAGMTIFHAMPPVLRSLLREVGDPALMAKVRLAYVAGDRLWGRDVRLLRQVLPFGSDLYTGIGSSECATLYRQWFVPSDWPTDDGPMPVGYALPDRTLRILREDGTEAAPGEPGRITVRGRTLARGYWRDAAETAKVFRAETEEAELVTFQTGDRGTLRTDGLLEFLGRGDRQVKIRGYRVEVVEVEAVMRGVAGVEEAGVVCVGEGDAMHLAGFLQGKGDLEATTTRVREVLNARLPSFMRPALLVGLEALPRLGNGKLDPRALRRLAEQRLTGSATAPAAGEAAPSPIVKGTALERLVRQEWRRVLGTGREGDSGRWDASGGNSLRALELLVSLERSLGVRLPANLLEPSMTWHSLAADLATRLASTKGQRSPSPGDSLLGDLYIVPWAPGASIHLRKLAEGLSTRFRAEFLELTTLPEEWERIHSIPDLARRCAESICARTPAGVPIGLVGMSFGGRVAMELAAELRARGHRVAMLGVVDIACKTGYLELAHRALQIWVEEAPAGMGWWKQRLRHARAWLRFHVGILYRWLASHRWQRALKRLSFGRSKDGILLANIRQSQIASWNPPWHPGELTLFITDDTKAVLGGNDPTFGWSAHADSVRVISLAGNHGTFLKDEHMESLVERILAVAVEAFAAAANQTARLD